MNKKLRILLSYIVSSYISTAVVFSFSAATTYSDSISLKTLGVFLASPLFIPVGILFTIRSWAGYGHGLADSYVILLMGTLCISSYAMFSILGKSHLVRGIGQTFIKRGLVTFTGLSFIGVCLFNYTIRDFSKTCIICYDDYHVIEKTLFGIVISRTDERYPDHTRRYPILYQDIFSKECAHVYKNDDVEFGLFNSRKSSIKLTMELYDKHKDKEVAREGYSVIDKLIPSEITRDNFQKRWMV